VFTFLGAVGVTAGDYESIKDRIRLVGKTCNYVEAVVIIIDKTWFIISFEIAAEKGLIIVRVALSAVCFRSGKAAQEPHVVL